MLEEIGGEVCTSFLNSSQGIRIGRLFQKASIWGAVSRERLAAALCECPSSRPDSQPKGAILLGARADLRPRGFSTKFRLCVCSFIHEATSVALDLH